LNDAHGNDWKNGSLRKATDEIKEFFRESENEARNQWYENPFKGHEQKDHFENASSTK
jgi:hypothetical protein